MSLHTLYRPTEWGHVVGQEATVNSLVKMLDNGGSQAFLLCGPSGVGKTTLARLAAAHLGCDQRNIIETNGAKENSVEDARQLIELMQSIPFGSPVRVLILDECHRLSKNAWDSLLKLTEEPPPSAYFFYCTTEPDKVPPTLITRSAKYTLKSVKDADLFTLLDDIAKLENIRLPQGVADLLVKEAYGSPRQLLVNLAQCRDVQDIREATELLASAIAKEEAIQLIRFIASGKTTGSWPRMMDLVQKLDGTNPESIRIVLQHYMAKVVTNAKNDKEACFALNVMEQFATPFNPSEGMAPLLRALGRVVF